MPQSSLTSFFSKYARVPPVSAVFPACTEIPTAKPLPKHPVRQSSSTSKTTTSASDKPAIPYSKRDQHDKTYVSPSRDATVTLQDEGASGDVCNRQLLSNQGVKRSRSPSSTTQAVPPKSPKERRISPVASPSRGTLTDTDALAVLTSSLTSLGDTPHLSQEHISASQTTFVRSSQSVEREDDLLSEDEAERYDVARHETGAQNDQSSDLSDLSDSDSDEELTIRPIDQILKRQPAPVTTPSTATNSRPQRNSNRPQNYYAPLPSIEIEDHDEHEIMSPTPIMSKIHKRPTFKYSMAALLAQNEKDIQSKMELERAIHSIDETQGPSASMSVIDATGFQRDIMASVIHTEEDDDVENTINRVMNAVERTGVTLNEPEYNFFAEGGASLTDAPLIEQDASNNVEVLDWLSGTDEHEAALLSGFTKDWTARFGATGETSSYQEIALFQSTINQESPWIRQGYEEIATSQHASSKSLKLDDLTGPLGRAGATADALDLAKEISAKYTSRDQQSEVEPRRRQQILHILKGSSRLAENFAKESRKKCLLTFLKMSADTRISLDCEMKLELQDTMSAFLASMCGHRPEDEFRALGDMSSVANMVYHMVKEPCLQMNIISCLSGVDFQSSVLRKRLALAWFLQDSSLLDLGDEPRIGRTIPLVLQKASSRLLEKGNKNGTDPNIIVRTVELLEIGLDAATVHSAEVWDRTATMTEEIKQAIKVYDGHIDRLCIGLKDIQGHLVDNSGANMARTEARGVLDRILSRLENVIRIKTKARRGLMEDHPSTFDTHGQQAQDLMQNWLGNAN